MPHPSQAHYLESKVQTASQPQLHRMLLEGAVRFGRLAQKAFQEGDSLAAEEPLLRTLDIVEEMLVGVRGSKTEISARLAENYLFIFRRLVEAKIHANIELLDEALRVLELERETWRQACEKFTFAPKAVPPPNMPQESSISFQA